MSALAPAFPKVAKLLPLLGSDRDGEVVAAAHAIGRTLAAAGLSFHDLAELVATHQFGTPHEAARGSRPMWRPASGRRSPHTYSARAKWCAAEAGHLMNENERGFIASLAGMPAGWRPTERQARWFDRIEARVRAREAA